MKKTELPAPKTRTSEINRLTIFAFPSIMTVALVWKHKFQAVHGNLKNRSGPEIANLREAPRIWSSLPSNLRVAESYSQFQRLLRNWDGLWIFADDTAIYLAISSEGESVTLQNDLHILEIWQKKRWDMSFNPSKCQVLHITRAKCPIQTRYILHGTVLESVRSAKYLGVTISNNLSWTPHPIDSVSKKANQTLGFLKRNIKVHSKDLKSTVYTT